MIGYEEMAELLDKYAVDGVIDYCKRLPACVDDLSEGPSDANCRACLVEYLKGTEGGRCNADQEEE